MKNIITFACCISIFTLTAQEKIPYIDASNMIEQADEVGAEGNYEQSLELLNTINKNDSLYLTAVIRKSYYFIEDDDFKNALKATNLGISLAKNDQRLSTLYNNKAVAFLNLDKPDKALETINTALVKYPLNYLLHYNRGQALEMLENIEEALKSYQKSTSYNPFYAPPHLKMGNLCYTQGLFAQALMCFNTYLLMNPDGSNSANILQSINNNVKTQYPDKKYPEINFTKNDKNYETINLVLNNHIALSEDYDTGNDIDIALTRQNHALLQQLKDMKSTEDYWGKRYLPLFQWIHNNAYFDDFIYTIAFSSEFPDHQKITSRKLKDIKEFVGFFREKWFNIISSGQEIINEKQVNVSYNYNKVPTCTSYGKTENGEKRGQWHYFYDEGNLKAVGGFNNKGKQDKDWKWYHKNGEIKETGTYTNGLLQNESVYYHNNGKVLARVGIENSEFEGEYKYYLASGALHEKKYFKKGTLDGPYVSYFKVGEEIPEFEATYSKGEITGELKEYYATAQLYETSTFIDGEIIKAEKYYMNGEIREKSTYNNNKQNGPYLYYYNNGQLAQEGEMEENLKVGPWKTYYKNGQVESEIIYDDGEVDDDYVYYDKDGKLYYKMEYRNGIILAYEYYDKDGNTIKEARKKGGEFFYEGYNPNGTLFAKGLYDIKGGKVGEWKYYSDYGVFFKQGGYAEGKETGKHLTFYTNGKEKIVEDYKNGLRDGYYVEYYPNNNIKQQGWYKQGKLVGEWREYYINGTLSDKYFFHDGEMHGESLSYSVEGELETKKILEYGQLMKEMSYNEQGQKSFEYNYNSPDKTEVLEEMFSNGKLKTKISYVNKVLHGPFKNYNVEGQKISEGNYRNGKLHGLYKAYYDNGSLKFEYNYVYGSLHGKLTEYYEDGSINQVQTYDYGDITGEDITYYKNGNISNHRYYNNGELHGEYKFYDVDGNLEMIRFYKFGKIIGYSYLNQNGEKVEMIPIKNGKAKVVTYFDNGNIAKAFEYFDGKFVNEYKTYHYNGKLAEVINFVEGEYHDKHIEYHKNGEIKRERNYEFGELQGETKIYYENGQLKSVTNYINDKPSGISKEYEKNGKQSKEINYYDGDIIALKTF